MTKRKAGSLLYNGFELPLEGVQGGAANCDPTVAVEVDTRVHSPVVIDGYTRVIPPIPQRSQLGVLTGHLGANQGSKPTRGQIPVLTWRIGPNSGAEPTRGQIPVLTWCVGPNNGVNPTKGQIQVLKWVREPDKRSEPTKDQLLVMRGHRFESPFTLTFGRY